MNKLFLSVQRFSKSSSSIQTIFLMNSQNGPTSRLFLYTHQFPSSSQSYRAGPSSLQKYQYTMKLEVEKWFTLVINSLHRIVSIVLKLSEIYANEVSVVNGKSLVRHHYHVITCIVNFIRLQINLLKTQSKTCPETCGPFYRSRWYHMTVMYSTLKFQLLE